jgi:hypothetical protein
MARLCTQARETDTATAYPCVVEPTNEAAAELDQLVKQAVFDGRDHVRRLGAENRLVSRHSSYPTLDSFDSGQPRIKHTEGPIDYASVFRLGETDSYHVSISELPALEAIGRLVTADENLRKRIAIPGVGDSHIHTRFIEIAASRVPLDVLDRLMHVAGDDFGESDFESVWLPIRNGLLWDQLPIDVVVPICLSTFQAREGIQLVPGVRLEPIPEGEQRARVPQSIWNAAASESVLAAATHAFVFEGYVIPGPGRMNLPLSTLAFYPLETIERAFQALRIATGIKTGYAQIVMRPIDWAWHYDVDLPPVVRGAITRRYPPNFDDYGWLQAPVKVTDTELHQVGLMLQHLETAEPQLRLASRRFSSATLRSEEEDSVLDLCIAIEAAVGDKQRTEMTYKLSLRAAALLAPDAELGGWEGVTRKVKRLYNWRSAIVHGDKVEHARSKFAEDEEFPLDIAYMLVREIMRRLLTMPALQHPEIIDARLLGGASRGALDEVDDTGKAPPHRI